MLILSRKRNEKIMIGDDISILIVDIRGDQPFAGVSAGPLLDGGHALLAKVFHRLFHVPVCFGIP